MFSGSVHRGCPVGPWKDDPQWVAAQDPLRHSADHLDPAGRGRSIQTKADLPMSSLQDERSTWSPQYDWTLDQLCPYAGPAVWQTRATLDQPRSGIPVPAGWLRGLLDVVRVWRHWPLTSVRIGLGFTCWTIDCIIYYVEDGLHLIWILELIGGRLKGLVSNFVIWRWTSGYENYFRWHLTNENIQDNGMLICGNNLPGN